MNQTYAKLRGRITEKCGTQAKLAEKIGLSERSLSLKLSGQTDWRVSEMWRIAEILDIPTEDIPAYFFMPKVQSIEPFNAPGT